MPGESSIEWCTHTWNPCVGCTRVSAGCDNCYAFALHDQRHAAWKAGRFPEAPGQYHKPFSEVQLLPERLTVPIRWTKPRRIFVNSMSDLFHAEVPAAFIAAVFAAMAASPQHVFQILTKRPQRMSRLLSDPDFPGVIERAAEDVAGSAGWCHLNLPDPLPWPLPNVWLGTSVESQEVAWRIDWLVKTPAAVRFLSCEPLLGPLDLGKWLWDPIPEGGDWDSSCCPDDPPRRDLHWVIVGGESGPDHRHMDSGWVRSLRDQCVEAGVPFFVKQDSGPYPGRQGRIPDDVWKFKEFPREAVR